VAVTIVVAFGGVIPVTIVVAFGGVILNLITRATESMTPE
jgi:hypothetical protein